MTSYMKEVAAILGLELGEEFKTKTNRDTSGKGMHYRITEEELEYFNTVYGEWESATGLMYKFLLGGKSSIIKKPWKPKDNDMYYVPNTLYGDTDSYSHMWGVDVDVDKRCYNAGLVCQDKESAEEMAKIMLDAVKKYNEKGETDEE